MPRVKDKSYSCFNNEEEKIYEVYGVQTCEEKYRDYEESWTEEVTYFLIYDYSEWKWVNSKYYVPVEV